MRPKSGLPKRKALRNMPKFECGFRDNPRTASYRHPEVGKGKGRIRTKPHSVVSLFAGCGGMDLGFLGGFNYLGDAYGALPFSILSAYDNDERAVETYRLNIADNCHVCDLTEVDMEDLPAADVLMGGFPCQDFSSCGPKTGLNGKRGRLYLVLADYMATHRPPVVVAENVPYLARLHDGSILGTILKDFEECGYSFTVWDVYCPDFGLPQSRSRLFLVGLRSDLGNPPPAPQPTHFMNHCTIDQAIRDLEDVRDESVVNQSQHFVATKATAGAGQGDQTSRRGELSYAVRANPKARVHFHYKLPRRLTVRECARLQSFPDEFVFPHSTSSNMQEIGNAVPPIIGHHVAQQVSTLLKSVRTAGVKDGSRKRRKISTNCR